MVPVPSALHSTRGQTAYNGNQGCMCRLPCRARRRARGRVIASETAASVSGSVAQELALIAGVALAGRGRVCTRGGDAGGAAVADRRIERR